MAQERQKILHVGGPDVVHSDERAIEARYDEYKHLVARAVEVFGDELDATRWLSAGNSDFAGRTPLQALVEEGPDHVLSVLGKIEHGVFF
jgi:uncharacterized protein (DUF2384 family)